jgi:hypothetical protein
MMAASKKYRSKIRWEALMHYSDGRLVCACCGESEYDFLSIDHIQGGGTKQRKEQRAIGQELYYWLKKNEYPEGFQVLCYNCNCAKGFYGMCPHERERRREIHLHQGFDLDDLMEMVCQ